MSEMKRRTVAFNTESALDKSLSDWCDQQSPNNFSGFIKMVLFAHKNGMGSSGSVPQPFIAQEEDKTKGIMSIL